MNRNISLTACHALGRNLKLRIPIISLATSLLFLAGCAEENVAQAESQHLERATAYQNQGQYKAAIIEYKNAVKKSGGSLEATVQYADMLNEIGQFPVALDLLSQAQGDKDKAYKLELAESYIGLRKFISAASALLEVQDKSDPQHQLLSAKVLSGTDKAEEAQAAYQKILAKDPQFGEARVGLATSLARQNKIEQALAELNKIDEKNDAYVASLVLKAGIQISQEQLEAAEASLSDSLSRLPNTDIMQPQKAFVLERLSYVLTRLGRSNEAYIYTKLLAEAFPGASEVGEQYKKAVEAFQARDMTTAKASLNAILSDYPNHNKAQQLLGIVHYLEGDADTAATLLDDSVDPEVADPMTRHIYAATNLKLNDPKKVLEILEPTISTTDSASTLALYGLAAISDKQVVKGEKALLDALKLAPEDVRIRLALANYYRSTSPPRDKEERQQLELAYNGSPVDRQVLAALVSYYMRHEQDAKAAEFISGLTSAHPKAYAPNLVSGYYYVSQKQLEKALGYFEQAVRAKGQVDNYSEALYAKGRSEFALKKTAAAEKTFTTMVKAYPNNELAYQGLYSVYRLKGDSTLAQQKLEGLAQRSAQLAPYLVLVTAAMKEQDLEQANTYFDKAKALDANAPELERLGLALGFAEVRAAMASQSYGLAREKAASLLQQDPDNVRLLSLLIELDIQEQHFVEAEKVLQQIEVLDAGHPVITVLQGDLAKAKNDLPAAKTAYAQSWKQNPTELVANKLFNVLGVLGDESGQKAHLTRWLEVFPQSEQATLLKAIRMQEQGQRTRAAELYEKVLISQPDNVTALNNLGWIYFEKGDQRSLTHLEKAAQLAPENPAVLDSYGWVLVKSGQQQQGLVYLEKANTLAPNIKEIAEHLAEARK